MYIVISPNFCSSEIASGMMDNNNTFKNLTFLSLKFIFGVIFVFTLQCFSSESASGMAKFSHTFKNVPYSIEVHAAIRLLKGPVFMWLDSWGVLKSL